MSTAAPTTTKQLGGKLAGKSLPMQVATLALWPFLELVLNALVGIVDTMIAGRLSVEATGAIAVAAYVGWLLGMLHGALGIGTAALVARAIGGRHRRLVNAAVGQGMLLALGWGVLAAAGLYLLAEPLAVFSGAEGETRDMAREYIQIVALTGPFGAALFTGNAILRAAGDTRTPFVVMAIVNAVNIGLSLVLVYAPAPLGGYGVAGIAAGTTGAWLVGGMVVWATLRRGRGPVRLRASRLRPHWHTARRIVKVGVPSLIESSGMWVGNVLVLRIVGTLGLPAALGAHIVAIRVESLSFMPAFAVGTAAAVLTGQYLGLGDADRARQAVRICWLAAGALMTAFGVAFVYFPEALARVLTNQPEIYEAAAPLIVICGPAQLFFGTYLVLSQALRGAGDTRATMVITYASTFAIRLPAAWVLGDLLGYGLVGVWVALCGELVIRGVIYAGRYFQGGWTKVEV